MFRKTVYWLHLSAGLIAGIVILIMSVTGVALAYEQQIIRFFDRGLRTAPSAETQPLPVEELLAKAAANQNATPNRFRCAATSALSIDKRAISLAFASSYRPPRHAASRVCARSSSPKRSAR